MSGTASRVIRRELTRIPGMRQVSTVVTLRRLSRTELDDPAANLCRLEAISGLTAEDYDVRPRLAEKLRWTMGRGVLGASYVIALAGTLGMLRRNLAALRVVEVFLGVTEADYRDLLGLAIKLRMRLSATADTIGTTLLFALVGALSNVGRGWEATCLLRADLGLAAPDPHTPPERRAAEFRRALDARLTTMVPDAGVLYLNAVILSLDELGVGTEGLPAVARWVGLQDVDHGSRGALDAALVPWLSRLSSPVTGLMALASYAAVLDSAGHGGECLAVVEWLVSVDEDGYRDVDALAERWHAVRTGPVPDIGMTLWRVWADVLVSEGRHADALAVIQADSGLRDGDLDDPARFGPILRRRLAGAQVDTSAAYVFSLVSDLADLGMPDPGARVAEWFLRSHTNLWSVPAGGDPAVRHVVPLLTHWLDFRGDEWGELAWQLSEQVVGYLRVSMLFPDTTIDDRQEFIGYVEGLRVHVRRLGVGGIAAGPLTGAQEQRVLLAQLWDAELGQRLLFERFVLTSVRPVAPAAPAADRWPLRVPEPVGFFGHLPDPEACRDEDMLRLLGARHRARVPAAPVAEAEPLRDRWLAEIETVLRAGVTPHLLGSAVGERGVLVRAGFRPDGALFWAAVRADGGELRLVAARAGAAGDRLRLRWASFRHDVGLLLASGEALLAGRSAEADPAIRTPAGMFADSLGGCVDTLLAMLDRRVDDTPLAWSTAVAPAVAALATSTVAVDEAVPERLDALCAETAATPGWEATLRTELRAVAELVASHRNPGGRPVMDRIDDVTRAYLRDVAGIWSLSPLLGGLCRDDDVLFQLEDVLQSVPVAHLPDENGTPLYRRVRSARVSLSLLLTILQTRMEAEFATDAPRLLALSHFGEDGDGAAAGAYATWLHHGQRWLAEHGPLPGATCLNAADDPRGAAGALRAALEEHGEFQTVTVCGHGSAGDAGMILSDGLWRGDGCDWRSVNLLILASCSVGRLEQVADRDVEGLCVRLALHRARSVLACRWPVIAPQAIAFSNEVVACYLRLRAEHGGNGAGLRARAVNEARHRFLDGDRPVPGGIVRLNTVAAFDLYGLG
ncbi:CHAT domain-containing protein [Actinophytocola oryzae]|uniref:CHAT domain-containing protein n=1 Tax=Actinophytocola oryzae TaxID=502181 RepID=A0A4R7UW37_9PSEU|nr:CHAT domain-containing protein [Actinophytocola oryzae]TDV40969.1 CHAT domain-containing protein [Actinophytocola oryzae]